MRYFFDLSRQFAAAPFRRQNFYVKRLGGLAVYQNFRVSVEIVYINQIIFIKNRLKLLGQKLGVRRADSQGNNRADVSENRVSDFFRQLGDKLMRHG